LEPFPEAPHPSRKHHSTLPPPLEAQDPKGTVIHPKKKLKFRTLPNRIKNCKSKTKARNCLAKFDICVTVP